MLPNHVVILRSIEADLYFSAFSGPYSALIGSNQCDAALSDARRSVYGARRVTSSYLARLDTVGPVSPYSRHSPMLKMFSHRHALVSPPLPRMHYRREFIIQACLRADVFSPLRSRTPFFPALFTWSVRLSSIPTPDHTPCPPDHPQHTHASADRTKASSTSLAHQITIG